MNGACCTNGSCDCGQGMGTGMGMMYKGRKWKNVFMIVALIAFSYSAVTYARSYAHNQYPSQTFTVSGEGKQVVIPDVASFTFSVITEGTTDLGKAQKENTEKANRTIAFVKSSGVDNKDIKTSGYNVTPRYQYPDCGKGSCPAPHIEGYTVTQSVEVKARNFDKVGDILKGVVDNGANSVSELTFKVDDDTQVQNKARATAIAQAREKAISVAQAGGFKLGTITSLYEETPIDQYAYGMGGSEGVKAPSAAPAPALEPGSQEVTVKVNVTFAID